MVLPIYFKRALRTIAGKVRAEEAELDYSSMFQDSASPVNPVMLRCRCDIGSLPLRVPSDIAPEGGGLHFAEHNGQGGTNG